MQYDHHEKKTKCIIIYLDSVAKCKNHAGVIRHFGTAKRLFGALVFIKSIFHRTPLTKAQTSQVQVGMSFQQVRFLLGSPTVTDPLNPLRWDYICNYTRYLC